MMRRQPGSSGRPGRCSRALRAGPLTNVEVMHLGGLRYSARLHELRRTGHVIETEEHKATGVTVYRLEGAR